MEPRVISGDPGTTPRGVSLCPRPASLVLPSFPQKHCPPDLDLSQEPSSSSPQTSSACYR